jgi:hypothetical protein
MSDPYNTLPFGDKQSQATLSDAKGSRAKKGAKATPNKVSALYQEGVELFRSRNIYLELSPEGGHVNHKIYIPDSPRLVEGINYPHTFRPQRELSSIADFYLLETVLESASQEVRDFWQPLVHPKAGDSDLLSFTDRKLKMLSTQRSRDLYEVLEYQHTFDPSGELAGGSFVTSPRSWVPARSWFHPCLQELTFEDVFTIFPPAERSLLKLLIGRIGVGRTGHLPLGFTEPIKHTARMAAVIIGQDPGLGKSTLFNLMIQSFYTVGLTSHTFRSTDDRFGLRKAALSDIAYKDDTALSSLKKFLASENTKILVSNGKLDTEEKFKDSEEVMPKCVLIVNSNDWDPSVCYDLDPGIIDRVKLLSTYREVELSTRKAEVGALSEESPDLRPYSHIPWLAAKLGVSVESLFLWTLRLCTDHFWEVISDDSDPSVNPLQVQVRHWTTRLRIKFKSDMSNSFMSALILSTMIRNPDLENWVAREMNYEVFASAIQYLWFVGCDPSGNNCFAAMKKDWEENGRIATHPYQAFRELRWETVEQAMVIIGSQVGQKSVPDRDKTSKVLKMMTLRDGFSLNTGYSFAISSWQNALAGISSLERVQRACLQACDEWDLSRLHNPSFTTPDHSWMQAPSYTPTNAEHPRLKRKDELRNRV